MINSILTPDEAKEARDAIGLSQAKVANGAGISRTKLALFEVKKYLLSDNELNSLKQFYESHNYEFESDLPAEQLVEQSTPLPRETKSPGVRIIDGYAIPEGMDQENIEQILSEITDNNDRIEQLSGELAGISWWSETPKREGVNEILRLMSRNYLITCQLQGRDLSLGTDYDFEHEPESITNGALLNQLIHN